MNYIKEMRLIIGNRPLLLVGTSVIAVKDGMILLQKRADTGAWGYPGGYLELGETPEESAKRELLEETGLIANKLALYGVFAGENRHFTYPNGHEVYCTDVVYTCYDFSPSGSTHDEEVLEVRWFSFDDLPADIAPSTKDVIVQFISEYHDLKKGSVEMFFAEATADDADIIFRLAKGLIEKYETDLSLDFARVFDWLKRKIARSVTSYKRILVDDVTIGYCCVLEDGDKIELDDLYILDGFQGQGYGTQVVERVVTMARDMDKAVFLYVFKENHRAMNLYQRHGFEIVESIGDSRYLMVRSAD